MAERVQRGLAGLLRYVSDHVAEFALGSERLRSDVDVLLAQHMVDAGENARQVGMQMRDSSSALARPQRHLGKVDRKHGRPLVPVVLKSLRDEMPD